MINYSFIFTHYSRRLTDILSRKKLLFCYLSSYLAPTKSYWLLSIGIDKHYFVQFQWTCILRLHYWKADSKTRGRRPLPSAPFFFFQTFALPGFEPHTFSMWSTVANTVVSVLSVASVCLRTFLWITRERKWNSKIWKVKVLVFLCSICWFLNYVCSMFWSWVWIIYITLDWFCFFFYLGCN